MHCFRALGLAAHSFIRLNRTKPFILSQERIQQHLFTFLDDNYLTKDDRQSSETGGRTMAEAFGLVKSDCTVIKEVSLLPLLVSQFESLMHHESSSSSGLMDEVSSTSLSVNTAYTRLLVRAVLCSDPCSRFVGCTAAKKAG